MIFLYVTLVTSSYQDTFCLFNELISYLKTIGNCFVYIRWITVNQLVHENPYGCRPVTPKRHPPWEKELCIMSVSSLITLTSCQALQSGCTVCDASHSSEVITSASCQPSLKDIWTWCQLFSLTPTMSVTIQRWWTLTLNKIIPQKWQLQRIMTMP